MVSEEWRVILHLFPVRDLPEDGRRLAGAANGSRAFELDAGQLVLAQLASARIIGRQWDVEARVQVLTRAIASMYVRGASNYCKKAFC